MRKRAICVVMMLLPKLAAASEWRRSFESPELAQAIGPNGRVGVVGIGAGIEAAAALEAALRDLDGVSVVVGQASFGAPTELALLDDHAILARADGMPLDLVAIVRISSQRYRRPYALVALYRPGAVLLRSLSVDEGVPLKLPAQPFKLQLDTLETYNDAKLEAREHESIFINIGEVDFTHSDYRIPIEGDDFFARVGRPDLARRWQAHRRARAGLYTLGGILLGASVGAIVTGAVLANQPRCDAPRPSCDPALGDKALAGGLASGFAGIAGGVLTMIGARRLKLAPVSSGEARQLADRYNRALRRRLGLEELSLGPTVSPTFMGARLTARF
jgi:hypothetical protein